MLLGGALFIVAMVGFAPCFSSFFRTRERALQLVTVTSLPMLFLSNLSWPMKATPRLLVRIAQLLPHGGVRRDGQSKPVCARLPNVSAELANLAIWALLYGALAMWRNRPGSTCSTTSSDSTTDSAVTHSLTDHHAQAMSERPPE